MAEGPISVKKNAEVRAIGVDSRARAGLGFGTERISGGLRVRGPGSKELSIEVFLAARRVRVNAAAARWRSGRNASDSPGASVAIVYADVAAREESDSIYVRAAR
jgi:hypothetical protein